MGIIQIIIAIILVAFMILGAVFIKRDKIDSIAYFVGSVLCAICLLTEIF